MLSCVRGYHIYQDGLLAGIGQVLECARDPTKSVDMYAVATKKEETIVGHLPKKISKVCSLFLRRRGSTCILCTVNSSRRYSSDIPHVTLFLEVQKKKLRSSVVV